MAIFVYTALDKRGREQTDKIEAVDSREAVRVLREQNVFTLTIVEGEEGDVTAGGMKAGWFKKMIRIFSPRQYLPVRAGDLIVFFRQIALMLRAGHPVVAALDANRSMVVKRSLRMAIFRMSENIRRGSSLSKVMAEEKRIFSPMMSRLIASGEQSGNLDTIIDRMADSLEQSRELKRQLIAAFTYPAIVFLGGVGVCVFLIVAVIPKFTTFLTARKSVLPPSTQLLVDISDWLQIWGMSVGVTTSLIVFFTLVAYTTRSGKKILDKAILYLPLVGKSVSYAAMAQAGWSLAMLLRNGVTALQSLHIISSVLHNRIIADCFERAAGSILEGKNLARAFEQRHIPQMMRHMVAVGESSGQLDVVMHDLGEYYQRELAALVKIMTIMIEPILIMLVGGMVGFVYYAFFQAVLKISTGGM